MSKLEYINKYTLFNQEDSKSFLHIYSQPSPVFRYRTGQLCIFIDP